MYGREVFGDGAGHDADGIFSVDVHPDFELTVIEFGLLEIHDVQHFEFYFCGIGCSFLPEEGLHDLLQVIGDLVGV